MINLNVPYLSQRDNSFNPGGTCNVTSLAMALKYLYSSRNFGCPRGVQLEDYFGNQMEVNGYDRHVPQDLEAYYTKNLNTKGRFNPSGKTADIKRSLDAGSPVIIHGWFTRSGHIIVLRGYDTKGFFVNDPQGEWHPDGYDTSASGENLHYSYGLISRTCEDEDGHWVHTW